MRACIIGKLDRPVRNVNTYVKKKKALPAKGRRINSNQYPQGWKTDGVPGGLQGLKALFLNYICHRFRQDFQGKKRG
jgi:hypothetical protein